MREAARRTGVSYDVIRELHRRPDSSTSEENARKLKATLALGTEPVRVENGEEPPPGMALVRVYDISASAGFGAIIGDYVEVSHLIGLPHDYIRSFTKANPRNLCIIGVNGDSMWPTLADDDIVMCDMSKTSLAYDGLFVLRFYEALHVKRVGRSAKRDHVMILSDNRVVHPPIDIPIEDVVVVGKVIWRGGKV